MRTMNEIPLEVIDGPDPEQYPLFYATREGRMPLWQGPEDGDTDYTCGICNLALVHRWKGELITNAVFNCPSCGAWNRSWKRSLDDGDDEPEFPTAYDIDL